MGARLNNNRHPGEGRGPEPAAAPLVTLDLGLRRDDERRN
jgi:hypothetical protein